MKRGPKKSVSVLLPRELHQELQILAQESSRSLAGYIRQELYQHLRDQPARQDDPANQTSMEPKQSPGR
ncbi:MAG: hypothetical protein AAGU16_15415 [Desulfitobacterium hafniense]